MPNPLLSPSTLEFQLPDYATLTDADYREAVEVGMAEQLAELDAIAADSSPATVENVLHAWERTGATLERTLSAFWVAKAADTNPERDAIMAEFAPRLAEHNDAIMLDRRLYDRLRALDARRDAGEVELDEQAAFLLSERLRDYERGGIHLEGADQERLMEINGRLATLSTEFDHLLVAGRNAAAVHVTDESHLAGLGESDVAGAAAAARTGRPGRLAADAHQHHAAATGRRAEAPRDPAPRCSRPACSVVSAASTTPGASCWRSRSSATSAPGCSGTRTTRRTSRRTAARAARTRSTRSSDDWGPRCTS